MSLVCVCNCSESKNGYTMTRKESVLILCWLIVTLVYYYEKIHSFVYWIGQNFYSTCQWRKPLFSSWDFVTHKTSYAAGKIYKILYTSLPLDYLLMLFCSSSKINHKPGDVLSSLAINEMYGFFSGYRYWLVLRTLKLGSRCAKPTP